MFCDDVCRCPSCLDERKVVPASNSPLAATRHERRRLGLWAVTRVVPA
jgi:hypothetical protein